MTKDEIIGKYGEEWYERVKAKSRKYAKEKYDANPEAERQRRRQRYAKNPEYSKKYREGHAEIYRINMRDRNRLRLLMKIPLDGKVVHHMKYHADNKDAAWIDGIMIFTPEEHAKWHKEHPDFIALDNVV